MSLNDEPCVPTHRDYPWERDARAAARVEPVLSGDVSCFEFVELASRARDGRPAARRARLVARPWECLFAIFVLVCVVLILVRLGH